MSSAKFKHLKFSENVNFEGTNSVDSILEDLYVQCFVGYIVLTALQKVVKMYLILFVIPL